MFDRLKRMPWRSLLLVGLATVAIATVIDLLLFQVLAPIPVVNRLLMILFSPPLGILIPVLAQVGVGALGVYLIETWQTQIYPNTGNLWALVACLLLSLWIKSLLYPLGLLGLSESALIGVVLGVFWKGRRYWR